MTSVSVVCPRFVVVEVNIASSIFSREKSVRKNQSYRQYHIMCQKYAIINYTT